MVDAPERIWVGPDGYWVHSEKTGHHNVEYVRADIAECENAELQAAVEVQRGSKEYAQRCCVAAEARAEDLSRQLAEARAEVARLSKFLGAIVYIADTQPFTDIGHVIEHLVPDARAALSGSGDGWRIIRDDETHAPTVERCVAIAVDIGQTQAKGWRDNPSKDGCGGEVAASNTGHFIATAIRALIKEGGE